MKKETDKMLNIIHNNCKQEQQRRLQKQNARKQELQKQQKRNKIILATGIICVLIEISVLIVERMVK